MKNKFILLAGLLIFSFGSCQVEFIPEPTGGEEEIVVEGFIEAGENATPTYVILTKSLGFFNEISPETFSNLFVRDAEIKVSDGTTEIELTELCLSDLPPELVPVASDFLGFDAAQSALDFCIYADLSGAIEAEVGGRYDLTINVEGKTLTATTTIPEHVPLEELVFGEVPGTPSDTLAELRCTISDPPDMPNYYRYFTQINDSVMFAGIPSVTDDRLFDGQNFEFPVNKHEPRNAEFDPETFGFYRVGDTLTLRWTNIDQEHFDFWNTLEFNALNQGPFSSYTRVDFNIDGGLGIWGGYSTSYYTLVVEK